MSVLAAAILVAQIATVQAAIREEFNDPTVDCVEVRPNVVCTIYSHDSEGEDDFTSELRLYRRGKLLNKIDGDLRPAGISLANPLHRRVPQVAVTWCCNMRNQPEMLYEIAGDELRQIGEFTNAYRTVDEDGDGVDEIITSDSIGSGDCGPNVDVSILKFGGFNYVDDAHYSGVIQCIAGIDCGDHQLRSTGNRIILHIVNGGKAGRRVRSAKIRVEGQLVPMHFTTKTRAIDVPVSVHDHCPALSAEIEGPDDAELWIFVRNADAPRTSSR